MEPVAARFGPTRLRPAVDGPITPFARAASFIRLLLLILLSVLPLTAACALDADVPPDEFREGTVHHLRLVVTEAELQSLREDPRRYVGATLVDSETVIPNVGLRLKGSAGSFRPIDAEKPGFTIKANQFVPGRRVWGLRKLLLNNCAQDPSYLCETIGNELFRRAGVPAARTAFAVLTLNDRKLGVYVVVEGVSRDFLARHFDCPVGPLLEGPGDIEGELDADAAGPFFDGRELAMLAAAAREPAPVERWRRLAQILDMPRVLSFGACETIAGHWDGYAAAANNFRLYLDPSTGRWIFLPHGGDQLFQTTDAPAAPGRAGFVANALYSTPEGQRGHIERLQALTVEPGLVDALAARILELAPRVRSALASVSEGEAEAHDEAVRSFSERIRDRFMFLREQLGDGAGVFPEPATFDAAGRLVVTGWNPDARRGDPGLERVEQGGEGGGEALWIAARSSRETVGSWRARVWLEPGAYRFQGRARTRGVVPMPTEQDEADGHPKPGGVCVRISGRHPEAEAKLHGDHHWQLTQFDFEVQEESAPIAEVELVCEMRAQAGHAEFDVASLVVTRR